MTLPVEYLGAVMAVLRREQPRMIADPAAADGIKREVERWQRLFAMGEIEESTYRREVTPLRKQLNQMERPAIALDVERAMGHLRDAGKLWDESTREWQRACTRRLFDRIIVRGQHVVELRPKAEYYPLFDLDRHDRFGGDFGVVWRPVREADPQNYTRYTVPALVAPPLAGVFA